LAQVAILSPGFSVGIVAGCQKEVLIHLSTMHSAVLLMSCLACAGIARRVQTSEETHGNSKEHLKSLAMLLANQPAAAFMPSGPGVALSRPTGAVRHGAMMSEVETAPEAEAAPEPPKFDVKELAGITAPLGFFDPSGFTTDATEGKIRFYREVELKHGRVGMLAAFGFLLAEQFHPLFGGDIDVPSYLAFQQTPLQTFWGAVVFAISILEVYSVFSFNSPFGEEPWSIRSDHVPGDLGFDPLGLKPTDPKELKEMQTKELNNGRLGMLAAAGMIAQELATGQKLF